MAREDLYALVFDHMEHNTWPRSEARLRRTEELLLHGCVPLVAEGHVRRSGRHFSPKFGSLCPRW